jgi:hypothetical protein
MVSRLSGNLNEFDIMTSHKGMETTGVISSTKKELEKE